MNSDQSHGDSYQEREGQRVRRDRYRVGKRNRTGPTVCSTHAPRRHARTTDLSRLSCSVCGECMCGILCIVAGLRFSTAAAADEAFLLPAPSPEAFLEALSRRGPDAVESAQVELGEQASLCLSASLLQLRGDAPVAALRSSDGSLFCWNGEVFGGVETGDSENDGEVLLRLLLKDGVETALSAVRGPWAFVFWETHTRTLWFGRDVLGRRRHACVQHSALGASSDALPPACCCAARAHRTRASCYPPHARSAMTLRADGCVPLRWAVSPVSGGQPLSATQEELPPGLYSIRIPAHPATDACCMRRHEWLDPRLVALGDYARRESPPLSPGRTHQEELLLTLDAAVARRVCGSRSSSVMLLFSGGLDSCLLAALAHRHIPASQAIDLCTVCFSGGTSADRQAAHAALQELRSVAHGRVWRLIQVDATLDDITQHRRHLLRLLHPRNTVMDLNIGAALWLAARGTGTVDGASFCSGARIVLLGTGADEQAAGYGRHRTAYRSGDAATLTAELEADVRRLWLRNLGRDDRLVSDCGREARFPFLDEQVVACLARMPLEALTDLELPPGRGDKLALRRCAQELGLHETAGRVKRAIQFGSGLSKLVNARDFGSGRQASACHAGTCLLDE